MRNEVRPTLRSRRPGVGFADVEDRVPWDLPSDLVTCHERRQPATKCFSNVFIIAKLSSSEQRLGYGY